MSETYGRREAYERLALGKKVRGVIWNPHYYVHLDETSNIVNQDGVMAGLNGMQPDALFEDYTPPKEEDHFNMQFMQAMKKYREGWDMLYDQIEWIRKLMERARDAHRETPENENAPSEYEGTSQTQNALYGA